MGGLIIKGKMSENQTVRPHQKQWADKTFFGVDMATGRDRSVVAISGRQIVAQHEQGIWHFIDPNNPIMRELSKRLWEDFANRLLSGCIYYGLIEGEIPIPASVYINRHGRIN